MLQHAHQHAFTPFPLQPFTPTRTQDCHFNTLLHRGSNRPAFAPVTAFHSTAQKTFSSTKQGRWGALHVYIAWKIHYKERLKKMQQTPYDPALTLPDKVQHKELNVSSCRPSDLDPSSEHLASRPSDLQLHPHTSSSASCHSDVSQREELDQHQRPAWKEPLDEKEKQSSQQINKTKDLLLKDKSLDQAAGFDGRLGSSADRKRQLDCNSFLEVKKAKQDSVEKHFDSSCTRPKGYVSDFSVVYPRSKRCDVPRASCELSAYLRAEQYPCQTMWDCNKRMDLYCRQNPLKDYSFKTCKVIRVPPAAQTPHGFSSTPLYYPFALREQENVYSREGECLHSQQNNCLLQCCRYQLPYQCFVQTSHYRH